MKIAENNVGWKAQWTRVAQSLVKMTIALSLFATAATAGANVDFFSASVPVASQSKADRIAAAQQGFAEVVVRISGSELVLDNAPLSRAQDNAIAYVEQFQYSSVMDVGLIAEGFNEQISLAFSAPAIERLLRDNNLPYWPINRPTTLVWLVEDNVVDGKQFINADIAPEVLEGFELASAQRGLPLSYPLLDLEDMMSLSAEQLWRLDEAAILEASERYSADAIVVGRYSTTSRGELLATWQFFHRGDSRVYDSRNLETAELGYFALNPLADYLGARYAIFSREGSVPALVLQLSGVNSFGDYRKALDYLENVAAVAGVFVAGVRQDTVLLHLDSDAGAEKFMSALVLDGRLEPVRVLGAGEVPVWQQIPKGSPENPLFYRWK
ncbi:DUF2066 domain-containing protein [Teredinibacter purpureus]|uniref:DUF2066 domain-containing protein n=1 Tax=Teredinibacter purpureus TaxID=2731756 RepID=UPI000A85BD59|nr:DUF2066 domain-containing protein [Teredinibacter purpureus]